MFGNGQVVAGVGEPLITEIYEGTTGVTNRAMGRDFTIWIRQQANKLPKDTAAIWVHTHPRGTLKPSGSSDPNAVGGPSGDYDTVAYTRLKGAIVTATKVVVFDANRPVCTFNR